MLGYHFQSRGDKTPFWNTILLAVFLWKGKDGFLFFGCSSDTFLEGDLEGLFLRERSMESIFLMETGMLCLILIGLFFGLGGLFLFSSILVRSY